MGMSEIYEAMYPGFEAETKAAGEAMDDLLRGGDQMIDGIQKAMRGGKVCLGAVKRFYPAAMRLQFVVVIAAVQRRLGQVF